MRENDVLADNRVRDFSILYVARDRDYRRRGDYEIENSERE